MSIEYYPCDIEKTDFHYSLSKIYQISLGISVLN